MNKHTRFTRLVCGTCRLLVGYVMGGNTGSLNEFLKSSTMSSGTGILGRSMGILNTLLDPRNGGKMEVAVGLQELQSHGHQKVTSGHMTRYRDQITYRPEPGRNVLLSSLEYSNQKACCAIRFENMARPAETPVRKNDPIWVCNILVTGHCLHSSSEATALHSAGHYNGASWHRTCIEQWPLR